MTARGLLMQGMRRAAVTGLAALVPLACATIARAAEVGEADFSSGAVIETFTSLPFPTFPPSLTPTPVDIGGNTYDTDNGSFRYIGNRFGTDTDLGFLDIVLDTPVRRAGGLVGPGANKPGATEPFWSATVSFFDENDVFLGQVTRSGFFEFPFAGWEADPGTSIKRVRFDDTSQNGIILFVDDFITDANLLENARFDVDLAGWRLYEPVKSRVAWDPMDAEGSTESGSALVTNVFSASPGGSRGISQCVEVIPGASYDFGGSIYIAPGQTASGNARFDVLWAQTSNCSGGLQTDRGPASGTPSQWVPLESLSVVAPENARGAQFLAQVFKSEATGEFAAFFDDVFFIEAPEPSITLLHTAALLALGGLAAAKRRP